MYDAHTHAEIQVVVCTETHQDESEQRARVGKRTNLDDVGNNIHIIVRLRERPPRLTYSEITQLCEIHDWVKQVRLTVSRWLIQRRIHG